ncbi:DUF6122 family protein [Hymenobacter sp. IS2118]|uniref:DUF6122 family protein n=1 Tax=Hymenobacter sp. IS2118 TaxID=1505605 RepID=UPI00190FBB00|nr:DUF6122 family protein [Hymenobacter sp. IS2118]
MLPLPVFRLIRYIAAGLVLLLAGCQSSAIVYKFAVAAESRPPRPVQRFDTATAVTAHEFPTTSQRRVKAKVRLRAADTLNYRSLEKKEQANQSGGRYPKATSKDTANSSTRPMTPRGLRQPSAPKLLSAQTLVHYSLHFVFPAALALVFFPLMWQTAYLIMLATMLMDLDHLLATPVFDPLRCSVGYHPLHSFYAIPVYALLLLLPATQIVAVGLLFHLFTDTVDCLWSFRHCHECYLNSRIHGLLDWVRKLLGREEVG